MSTPKTPASLAASSLRAKQKPLKDIYRSDPSAALVTLTSSGNLDPTSTSPTCALNSSTSAASKRIAGLHEAAGGEGFNASGELCSGDMLLESLVACFGVTIRAVAMAMAIQIKGGSVLVQGDLDFRGTLGIKDADGGSVDVGFKSIKLTVRLEVGLGDEDKVQKLVELSERYCVVLQTIRRGVEVGVSVGHVGGVRPDTRKDEDFARNEDADGVGGKGEGMEDMPGNEEVLKLQ